MDRNRPALPGQLRAIAIGLHRFGLHSREGQLGYCSAIVGRPITSRHHLSALEASRILDAIEGHLCIAMQRDA